MIALDLVVAFVLFIAGLIFGLNGEQWSWWTYVCWAGVLIVAVGVGALAIGRSRGPGRGGGTVAALLGLGVVALALLVMAANYSDPYSGALLWPHALALVALTGFALLQFGFVNLASNRTIVGEHS